MLIERIQIGGFAQIRKQQKALLEVLRKDLGHVHSGFGKETRYAHERPAVLLVGRRVHCDE